MVVAGVSKVRRAKDTVVDPTNRFLITASGDRGWQGEATKVVLIHDIKAS